jgi:hypothetical protein
VWALYSIVSVKLINVRSPMADISKLNITAGSSEATLQLDYGQPKIVTDPRSGRTIARDITKDFHAAVLGS